MDIKVSRRAALSVIAISPRGFKRIRPSDDEALLDLGRRFNQFTSEIDHAHARELPPAFWSEFDLLINSIVDAPAKTMDGLLVKARAAAWALLGDVQPRAGTVDHLMSLSIIRDLIIAHDPQLYDPGALTRLAENRL